MRIKCWTKKRLAVVQRRQDPRPLGVEGQALDSVALCLKFGEHFWLSHTQNSCDIVIGPRGGERMV